MGCPLALRLGPGEGAALTGPSGCGKSTYLRVAAGLHTCFDGRRRVGGGVRIGYMPQEPCLLPFRTVEQNITGMARAVGRKGGTAEAMLLCRRLGLEGMEGRYPAALSGGQYRRAMLARTLAAAPRLLLLDEPFTGLDGAARALAWNLLDAYLASTGAALLLTSHDAEGGGLTEGAFYPVCSPAGQAEDFRQTTVKVPERVGQAWISGNHGIV